MTEGYMSNLYELENILIDVVRRRLEREGSVPTLTPIEIRAAEILVEIFKIKMECLDRTQLADVKDYSWTVSKKIHETE